MLSGPFLEVLNGTLFILTLCVLTVFCYYIVIRAREGMWGTRPVEAAVAFSVFLFGEALIRGWVWYWRHRLNDGTDVTWMADYPLLIAGGLIATVGMLCLIRVFTPVRGCNWPWMVSAVLAVATAAFLTFTD